MKITVVDEGGVVISSYDVDIDTYTVVSGAPQDIKLATGLYLSVGP